MIRRDCLELIAPLMTDQLVLSSQSGQRIEWFHLSQHEGNLLVGMMGCATGVGMGLALALPHRRVIVLESDGSVLLSLFNLPTLGNLNLSNLTVFVFDNEVYSGSTMSEPTATAGKTDLAAIARASGVENAVTVVDHRGLQGARPAGCDRSEGLHYVVCKVEESLWHREIPRPTVDLAEYKYRFVRYIERTEGKTIPFVGLG